MSTETRQKLVDHPRLVLANHSQRAQLLDPQLTNTWLIQLMLSIVQSTGTPLLVTAINTDHSPGTYHNPSGRAFDGWNANWASAGDDKVRDILEVASWISQSFKPQLVEVGLSGASTKYKDSFNYNCSKVFIESYSSANEHIHLAVGTPT
jgi:hypothetical protein